MTSIPDIRGAWAPGSQPLVGVSQNRAGLQAACTPPHSILGTGEKGIQKYFSLPSSCYTRNNSLYVFLIINQESSYHRPAVQLKLSHGACPAQGCSVFQDRNLKG